MQYLSGQGWCCQISCRLSFSAPCLLTTPIFLVCEYVWSVYQLKPAILSFTLTFLGSFAHFFAVNTLHIHHCQVHLSDFRFCCFFVCFLYGCRMMINWPYRGNCKINSQFSIYFWLWRCVRSCILTPEKMHKLSQGHHSPWKMWFFFIYKRLYLVLFWDFSSQACV